MPCSVVVVNRMVTGLSTSRAFMMDTAR